MVDIVHGKLISMYLKSELEEKLYEDHAKI